MTRAPKSPWRLLPSAHNPAEAPLPARSGSLRWPRTWTWTWTWTDPGSISSGGDERESESWRRLVVTFGASAPGAPPFHALEPELGHFSGRRLRADPGRQRKLSVAAVSRPGPRTPSVAACNECSPSFADLLGCSAQGLVAGRVGPSLFFSFGHRDYFLCLFLKGNY